MSEQPVSIITGAATGIGYTLAKRLLNQGHSVVLNDVDDAALERSGDKLELATGNDAVALVGGNAGSLDTIDTLLRTAQSRFGGVDNVIANAGITTFGRFLDYQPEQLQQLLSVNIQGSFFIAQRAAQAFIEKKQPGKILFMSSVTGIQYHPDLSAYGMTKAALRMLARNLGAELAEYGITVNCVAPGATATERTEEDPDYSRTWAALTPTGRVSTPGDIAAAACFLLSDEAAQITGQTLVIDGGWTLQSPTNHTD